jgi:frataxin-like iron-binding protein CyaY
MSDKYYISVPYEERIKAKEGGAKWCKDNKMWYVEYIDDELLDDYQILYLKVKYDDKDKAKSLGAKFDASRKQWYCTPKDKECLSLFGAKTG